MKRSYEPLELAFPREDWMLSRVLEKRAQSHGEKTFLKEGEGRARAWTYRQIWEQANTIGRSLMTDGFGVGDRLGILLRNCPEYVLAWFGSSVAGVVEVPINPEYAGSFLEHAINLMGPRGVVTSPEFVPVFSKSAAALPADLRFYVVGDDREDVASAVGALTEIGWDAQPFDRLFEADSSPVDLDLTRRDLGAIISTSGTTGPSKGVMMSNSQLYFFAEETKNVVKLTEDDIYMLALPLFHGNAQFMTVYPALIAGASLAMYEKFSPGRFLDRVRAEGITVANFVGVIMDWVWREPEAPDDADTTLRCVMSAPTPAELAGPFKARFGLEAVPEVYGQTEICVPFMSPYGVERPAGAAGVLVDEFFEVALVDPETDEEVPDGEVGELIVRPREPWLINSGYWGMPGATADARRNVWFHTGDGMRCDDEGWYFFTDRIKDALRRRGENISSYEVEAAVQAHPCVAECAVIAIASEYKGGEDEVMVVIVPSDGFDLHEVVEWCGDNMPKFLYPRYWRVVDELPKTPSEKIQKARLRKDGVTNDTFDRENAE